MPVNWRGPSIAARVRVGAQKGLIVAAELVRKDVVTRILEGQKTGRMYSRRGVVHQASAPGEAPASDTGRYVNSIRTDYGQLAELVAKVVGGTNYGAALEYGTQRMAARPHMRPAMAAQRGAIEAAIARAVARAVG